MQLLNITSGLNSFEFLLNINREHCMQVIRGDYSEIHIKGRTNINLMIGNLKFQAYQTAYVGT